MDEESFINLMVLARHTIDGVLHNDSTLQSDNCQMMYDKFNHEIFHDYPYGQRSSGSFKHYVLSIMSMMMTKYNEDESHDSLKEILHHKLYGNVINFNDEKRRRAV